jgi:SLT domain-containing protein
LFKEKGRHAGGVAACTDYAVKACEILGVPTTFWVPGLVTIAGRETAFNDPQWQINTTDLNAKNVAGLFGGGNAPDGYPGQCSRGGWQCIPQTFAAYHVAGTSLDMYNPIASAAAGMNYIILSYGIKRDGSDLLTKPLGKGYGSANGFGIQQADPNRPARGY